MVLETGKPADPEETARGDDTVEHRVSPPKAREEAVKLTLELGVSDLADLLALHAARPLTARSARLDRVAVQVLGQPAQVAVARERVASQMPERRASRV